MSRSSVIAAAVVALALPSSAVPARAQSELATPASQPVARLASLASGSIAGLVQDDKGSGIAGAVVSAVGAFHEAGQSGAGSVFATTDRSGRFELRALLPGPYLVRAHVAGFAASRGQLVEVRPSQRASSAIALHRVADVGTVRPVAPVLEAGFGEALGSSAPAPPATGDQPEAAGPAADQPADDDHGEVAWRLRHARRSVLNDATLPLDVADLGRGDAAGPDQPGWLGRAATSPTHFASSLFAATPFSGQVNLLTTGSFDAPQQLFSSDGFARGIAYLELQAPVSDRGDWAVRGALTQGDVSSWIVAAAYATRAPARHRYDVGVSYSTQEYGTGNPVALRDGTTGSRSAGASYAFDTFSISPALSVTYGARLAHYDYLSDPTLLSPRAAVTVSPIEHVRVNAAVSRKALAPGAEEFVPPVDSGIWLPPQRTFSSLSLDHPLQAERTDHVAVGIERDVSGATVSVGAFRQHVAEQIATLFGVDLPGSPEHLGHYYVASVGDVDTCGWTAGLKTSASRRVHGSVEYSQARSNWVAAEGLAYMVLVAPAASRSGRELLHDVATTLETEVPETSTRVVVLYRIGNGYTSTGDRPAVDTRFDVQVRQSLHFMDFSNTKWEMLLAVSNVFRETGADSSVYDELLVVRPPKRVVGGLTLRF